MDVVIEIRKDSRIKYEFDFVSKRLRVDRVLNMPMAYPLHYGHVPGTLAEDGDELDAVVYASADFNDILPNTVLACRPVGVVCMEDEKGMDHKIICVPMMDSRMDNVRDLTDVDEGTIRQLHYFFDHYKQFYKDKWSRVLSIEGIAVAEAIISEAQASCGPLKTF